MNNVYVASFNHGYDSHDHLAAVPMGRVVQAYRLCGGASMLLEWDAEIPSFAETHTEALRAHDFATFPGRDAASDHLPVTHAPSR